MCVVTVVAQAADVTPSDVEQALRTAAERLIERTEGSGKESGGGWVGENGAERKERRREVAAARGGQSGIDGE